MTTLTVALPLVRPTVGTEFSYVFSPDGATAADHGIAPLALLPAADRLVLVVPSRLLSWHAVRLPPVAGGRLRQALEGLLEDRLLDEPAQLAFALAPQRGPDGTTVVAVLDKSWLRAALAFFEQGQRPAARVVPELAPCADAAATRLVVSGTAQEPWLALADKDQVVSAPLASALELFDAQAWAGAPLIAEPEVAELAEHQFGRAVGIVAQAQRLHESSRTDWELAQFDLALSQRGRLARRGVAAWQAFVLAPRWRAARWGLGALALANLVGLNAWAWQQERAVSARREQVRTVFLQAFPKVRTVVDAPRQMERELAALRQSSGALAQRDLEAMLGALGQVLPPGKHPVAINFAPGEASARGLGLEPAQASQVVAQLNGMGYTARLDGDQLVLRTGSRP